MSYRCTMSRIRWFSGSTVLAIALVGTACRSESERAEGAVREPGDRTTDDRIAPPEGQNQKPGQEAREQAERAGDKAEQLAREGQELGREAREQAERVGEKAEQLAERGREVGREVNEQMNRVGEQTGALKGDQGSGAREQAAPTPAPRDQGAPQGREAQGREAQGREAQGQTQGREAQGREAQGQTQGRAAQGQTQGREAQGQTGGARDKDQAGGAVASTREAWTQEAKDNDYQVSFNRDGSVVATKEAKGSGERLSDDALRNAVGGKLAGSDHETVKKLSVTVRNGVVTLQGNVANVKEATEAVNEAMEAEGVTKVISQIRFGSSP
ncbi:BON domain-containing protein [Sorangium sp. So ce861]|uniref:BON domain-containing protein n=1 Tax=Sorangium sp. So ce861 TaxID=3133323 RepID=UPI003F642368